MEFIKEVDLPSFTLLASECGKLIVNLAPYLQAVVKNLTVLSLENSKTVFDSISINWLRMIGICSKQNILQGTKISKAWEECNDRLTHIYETVFFVDFHNELLLKKIDFFLAGWFRIPFLSSFKTCYKDPNSLAQFAAAYFGPFQSIQSNIHQDCPEEIPLMCSGAQTFCNSMISEITTLVRTLLKYLWDNISLLELQTHPVAAAKRTEKYLLKKDSKNNGNDF
jgi:hypothetical protein